MLFIKGIYLLLSHLPTSPPRHRRLPPTSSATHRIAHPHRPPSIYMRFGDALLRRPRKRSRLQLTPDRVGGTRTDAYAPRSAAADALLLSIHSGTALRCISPFPLYPRTLSGVN